MFNFRNSGYLLIKMVRTKDDAYVCLINLVRIKAALWDKIDKDYKNINTKRDYWSEIVVKKLHAAITALES